jgi:hypothetical protein
MTRTAQRNTARMTDIQSKALVSAQPTRAYFREIVAGDLPTWYCSTLGQEMPLASGGCHRPGPSSKPPKSVSLRWPVFVRQLSYDSVFRYFVMKRSETLHRFRPLGSSTTATLELRVRGRRCSNHRTQQLIAAHLAPTEEITDLDARTFGCV